ncbi:MAG: Gfo/Idh/MocA family oxidoreductase, partial [Chloroflexi bacterium]|nr:Gfo/Idh/MocA family oxidoreductase [Chloroflexota bacterium]
RALQAAGDRVEVVAAVDIDAARLDAFCEQYRIPAAYADPGAMLAAARPDLVHICTPPGTHLAQILACLEAGAWVYCEKPLCASLAELDQIEAAEARTGNYVSSVLQWRFGSAARHIKGLIERGEMGRPLVGVCQTLWYRDASYYTVPWRGRWETEVGGTSIVHGIHLMDLFLWLIGSEWQEIRAMIGTLDRPIEDENVSLALVQFESGAFGSITTSAISPRQESYLRLDLQQATVEVRGLYYASNANWQISLPDGAANDDALRRWQTPPDDFPGTHTAQLIELLDSLERRERPLVSGSESRRILEFLASLYKAAITGQPVQRGSIRPGDPFYTAMHGHAYSGLPR